MTYEQALDRFLNGGCAAFALALWEAFGKSPDLQFSVLSNTETDGFDDDCPFDPTHIYLDAPGFEMDVGGQRSAEAMATDLDIDSWALYGPYPFDELATFAGDPNKADRPIDLAPSDLAAAREWIARNPTLYRLAA